MPKYLFLIEPFLYDSNGVSVCYRNLIRAMIRDSSHSIMIISPDGYRDDFGENGELESLRIQSFGLPLIFFTYPSLKFIMLSYPIVRKVLHFQPDFIHCVQPGFCSFWALLLKQACRLFGTKNPLITGAVHTDTERMISCYNLQLVRYPFLCYLKIERSICDGLLTVDHRKDPNKFVLWKLGVDDTLFYPKQQYEMNSLHGTVIVVARLAPEKNFNLVIELAQILPEVTFQVFGDGPLRKTLQRKAPHNFLLQGSVSQKKLAQAYRASDVSLVPGTGECHPLSLLESLACGTPVFFIILQIPPFP
ncbi:Sulfoquinovosyl transferase SQD2 [Galdieria sulphuraria]|nr:Sulfoquinovosyl transferase SQD2 [Galdieria sulphuraria]